MLISLRLFPLQFATVAMAALISNPAQADCVDGTREPRPAEREFHDRAMAALVSLLPPVPPGAKLEAGPAGPDQADRLTFMCKEQKEGQFQLLVRRSYAVAPDKAAEQRAWDQRQALAGRIQTLQRLPAEAQAEQNRITAQVNEAENRRMQLLKNKDQSGADALYQREIKPLNDRWYRIRDDHLASVKPQVEALEAERKALDVKPQSARVVLALNQARLPSAGSAALVGSQGVPAPQHSQGLKVLNAAWAVQGEPSPLRDALAAALAVERLRALVGQPLPSVEASKAMAASLPVPALPAAAGDASALLAQPAPVGQAGQAAAPTAAPVAAPTAAPVATATGATTSAPPSPAGAVTAAAAQSTAAPAPAAPGAATAPKPPASAADTGKTEAVKKAAEGLQKLRGLLGR